MVSGLDILRKKSQTKLKEVFINSSFSFITIMYIHYIKGGNYESQQNSHPNRLFEQSKSALKLAGFFTKIYGSTIDLIHIVPFSMYMSESMDKLGLPFDMDKDLYPKVVERLNRS